MTIYEQSKDIINTLFGRDYQFALATSQAVRTIRKANK